MADLTEKMLRQSVREIGHGRPSSGIYVCSEKWAEEFKKYPEDLKAIVQMLGVTEIRTDKGETIYG